MPHTYELFELLEQESHTHWDPLEIFFVMEIVRKNLYIKGQTERSFFAGKSIICREKCVTLTNNFDRIYSQYARGLLEQDEHVPWTHLVISFGQHMERRSPDYDFNRFLLYFFHLGIFWMCDTRFSWFTKSSLLSYRSYFTKHSFAFD